jgi:anaerobic magnesium-protoporphyrin IX monomethyl ester cyclase
MSPYYRLLLIEPPFYRLFKDTYALVHYPLSLGYLAAAVKMHTDWEVVVYNSDFLPASDPFEAAYFTKAGFTQYQERLHDLSADIWQEIKAVISQYRPTVVGVSAKSANFAAARQVAGIAKEVN